MASTLTADQGAPALIAGHLLAARDFGQARRALVAAAEQHVAVHAYRDAAHALRTALDGWPSGDEGEARLLAVNRLARCTEMCAEYPEAVVLLRELADGHQRRGDRPPGLAGGSPWPMSCAASGNPRLRRPRGRRWPSSASWWAGEAGIDRLAVAARLRSAARYSMALATLDAVRDDAQSASVTICCCAPRACGAMCCRGWAGRGRESPPSGRHSTRHSLDHSPTPRPSCSSGWPTRSSIPRVYRAAKTAYAAAYHYCDAHGANDVGELCRACATAVLFSCGEWDRAAGVCEEVPNGGPGARPCGKRRNPRPGACPARSRAGWPGPCCWRAIWLPPASSSPRWSCSLRGVCASWTTRPAGAAPPSNRARQILGRRARTQERRWGWDPAVAGRLLRRAPSRAQTPGPAPRSWPALRRPPASQRLQPR